MTDGRDDNKNSKPISSKDVRKLVSSFETKMSSGKGDLQKEIKLLYALLEAVRTFNEPRSLEDLLSDIVDSALNVCDAQRGSLHFSVGESEPTKVARTAEGDSWDVSDDEYSESTLRQVLESGRRLVLDEDEDALLARSRLVVRS